MIKEKNWLETAPTIQEVLDVMSPLIAENKRKMQKNYYYRKKLRQ